MTSFTIQSTTSDTTTACMLAMAAAQLYIAQQTLASFYFQIEAPVSEIGDEEIPALP